MNLIRGRNADLIIVIDDDRVMTKEEQWAWNESEKIKAHGDKLGEPVHPFVQYGIYMAVLGARRRGRRDARSSKL